MLSLKPTVPKLLRITGQESDQSRPVEQHEQQSLLQIGVELYLLAAPCASPQHVFEQFPLDADAFPLAAADVCLLS